MPDATSVTIALALRPYQRTLLSTLQSAGILRRFLNLGPELEVRDPLPDGTLGVIKRFPFNKSTNRVVWALWRRLPPKSFRHPPIAATAWLADHALANWIEPTTIFHASTAFCLTSLRAARRKGATTLVESGTRHPRHWRQAALDECARFGVDDLEGGAALPEVLIRRMEREFQTCDRIVVPSSVAHKSFAEMGYQDKTVVVLPGVDTEFFSPPPQPVETPLFRVCYMGRVQAAKGLGYLLQAWKRLALPKAELLLVGEATPAIQPLLRKFADSTVRVVQRMSPAEIADCYRKSRVFVFPSVSEGLAEELLEAMASGLPIVASDMSGASDCLEQGKEGWIVPIRNIDALADAILWCYRHTNERMAMGEAARDRIEGQFTLRHYNDRLIALYHLLGMGRVAVSEDYSEAVVPAGQ